MFTQLWSNRKLKQKFDIPVWRTPASTYSFNFFIGYPLKEVSLGTCQPVLASQASIHWRVATQHLLSYYLCSQGQFLSLAVLRGGTDGRKHCNLHPSTPILLPKPTAATAVNYYAALLPRRGRILIASHSVCPSVCLSVRPSRYRYRASRRAT